MCGLGIKRTGFRRCDHATPMRLHSSKQILEVVVVLAPVRSLLGVIIVLKADFFRLRAKGSFREVLAVCNQVSCRVTKASEIGHRNKVMPPFTRLVRSGITHRVGHGGQSRLAR